MRKQIKVPKLRSLFTGCDVLENCILLEEFDDSSYEDEQHRFWLLDYDSKQDVIFTYVSPYC